jgi:hypothetical protein
MNESQQHIIYTIGHSTHSIEEFLAMLQSFDIKNLVDIRSLPGSRKYPQFDQENLQLVLPENGMNYLYMKDWVEDEKCVPIQKTHVGETLPFKVMPIIWKPICSKTQLLNWKKSLHKQIRFICVPKRFGGDVIAQWCPII